MADNHNLDGVQAPVLEETTYDPSKSAKRSLDGIQAPTLEDTAYIPEKKTAGLGGVAAPVLSDTYSPTPQYQQYGGMAQGQSQQFSQYAAGGQVQPQQYSGIANGQSQQFSQYTAGGQVQPQQYGGIANGQSQQFSQYAAGGQVQPQQYGGIANGQSQQFSQYTAGGQVQPQQYSGIANGQSQQFSQYAAGGQVQSQQFSQYAAGGQVQSQQFSQYAAGGQVQSQQFSQYAAGGQPQQNGGTQSNHTLDDVQKPVLDDEPPAQQRYVPKFVDPDVEAAKKQAVDRAIKSSLNSVPESFDQEKSREVYREFMREKEADMAKKGGVTVIILMIVGLVSGLLTLLFSFGALREDVPGIIDTFNTFYMVLGIAFMGASAAMLVKSPTASKAASTIFTVGTILHFIPGIIVMFSKASKASSAPMYVAVLIINIAICFIYGSSENIKKHYNGHGRDEYY